MESIRKAALFIVAIATLAVLLVALIVVVAFEAGLLLLVGMLSRVGDLGRRSRERSTSARVIDGEYTVLGEPGSPARHPRA